MKLVKKSLIIFLVCNLLLSISLTTIGWFYRRTFHNLPSLYFEINRDGVILSRNVSDAVGVGFPFPTQFSYFTVVNDVIYYSEPVFDNHNFILNEIIVVGVSILISSAYYIYKTRFREVDEN